MNLSDCIADYLAYAKHEQGLTTSTLRTYGASLRAYLRWVAANVEGAGEQPELTVLTTVNLRKYMHKRSSEGLRPRTIRGLFHPMRGLIGHLNRANALQGDPLAGIKMPAKDGVIRYSATDDDCEKLLEACDRLRTNRRCAMAKAIISLLVYAGLRAGEVISLKLADVDLVGGNLHITHSKGRKNRDLFPAQPALDAVACWLKERKPNRFKGRRNENVEMHTDYLFAYDPRRRISYNGLCALLNELKRIAGLAGKEGLCCHSIRHSFAKRMMNNQANVRAIQAALGHSEVATTFQYLEMDKDAARAMRDTALLTSDRVKESTEVERKALATRKNEAASRDTKKDFIGRARQRIPVRERSNSMPDFLRAA